MSMNKKWTKISSSGKFNLKVQCLIENLYTRESESKSYFGELFWNIQGEEQR